MNGILKTKTALAKLVIVSPQMLYPTIFSEFAKLRAFRALRAKGLCILHAHVPKDLSILCAYLPTYLPILFAYVP